MIRRKRKNVRSKRVLEEEDNTTTNNNNSGTSSHTEENKNNKDSEDDNVVETIEQIRLRQKLRGAMRDIEKRTQEKNKEGKKYGLRENANKKQRKDVVEQQMEEYINTELSKRGFGENGTKKEEEQSEEKKSEELQKKLSADDDELYTTPASLQQEERQAEEEEESSARWLTGIVEVQLPVEYKIRNIEETEQAKQKVTNSNKDNSNYSLAPKNYDKDFGRKNRKRHHPSKGDTSNTATDEIVYERFKKRFRARR